MLLIDKRYSFLKVTFCLFFFSLSAFSQQPLVYHDSLSFINLQEKTTGLAKKDSLLGKRNFLRATGSLALVEIIPWSYSYFITKTDFAKISFKSVGRHLKLSGWTWDDDGFTTNQFAHPYHGNLYFNSFRANGYSIESSALATVGGSLVWEIVGETQASSPNDLINTSFGGIILGEMTHRLTNKLLNNNFIGLRRKTNEIFGLLINPMNGFNRIIDGKWGKPPFDTDQIDSSKIDAQFDLGIRRINTDHNLITKGKNVLYGRMRLLYQDEKSSKKPFDEFSVDMEVGVDDSALVNTLSVYGLLYGRELLSNDRVKYIAVLSANYDLFHNSSFFYGGQSVNMNIMSEYKIAQKSKINTAIGIGSVLLAAVPDQYMNTLGQRNYDYGSGISLVGNVKMNIKDRVRFGVQYTGGIVGIISGNHSSYSLHSLTSELSVSIMKPFSINVSSGFFTVKGNYRDYADIKKLYSFGRISFGYQVIF